MPRFLTLLSILLFLSATAASSADLKGRVVSAVDSSAIVGATILVAETGELLTSDLNGSFFISGSASTLHINVSHVAFSPLSDALVDVQAYNLIALTPRVLELNPVVVTAKRYEQQSSQVSQSITVFPSDQIEREGHTTVTDAIRHAPGLDVTDAGPFRARPVLRGLSGTRVLVLVDGERLNDQRDVVDFAGVSMSLMDINRIDRIEVLNGPSSVLYGSDAMAGVINILTKTPGFSTRTTPYLNYSSRYSSADQQNSNRVEFGVKSQTLSLSGSVLYREAEQDFSPPDGWQAEDPRYGIYRPEFYDTLNSEQGSSWSGDRLVNSRARINNYDFDLAWKLSDRNLLNIDIGAFRGSDIGFPGVPNDSTPFFFYWPHHDRDYFSLAYSGTGLKGKLARVSAKFYYQRISKDFFTDFMDAIVIPAGPPPNPPTITPQTVQSGTEVKKTGINLQGIYQPGSRHTLNFGIDALSEGIDGSVTSVTRFEGFGPFPFNDTSHTSSVPRSRWYSLGLFASSEYAWDWARLDAGVRFDNYWLKTEVTSGYVDDNNDPLPAEDETYNSINASLGMVVPLTESINAVGNLGTAHRVPNLVERFFYGSASGQETRPNPDIKAEKGVTIDLGLKSAGQLLNSSIIGFSSSYRDFTQLRIFATDTATGQPLWRYENVDRVAIYGLEASLEIRLENGLWGGLTFSYQHGQNQTEDQPIFVSPLKTSLRLGYTNPKNRHFGEVDIHRVQDQSRIPLSSFLNDITTRGYTLVDVRAGIRLWHRLLLALNIDNLFDKVYSQPFNGRNPDNPVPEPGRNFIVSASAAIGN